MANELDKTIEELEAEVLSELEEGAHDAPMKSAGKADPMEKPKGKTPGGEVQDTSEARAAPPAERSDRVGRRHASDRRKIQG